MSSLVSRALESQYGDGEHIETFSRQSATCKSFANHLSVSYALSYCFVAVAPVFHFGAIVTERTLPPPLGGGCRSRISRSLDPLKVPCRSWLSKACGSRQPSSPLAVLFFFRLFCLFSLVLLFVSLVCLAAVFPSLFACCLFFVVFPAFLFGVFLCFSMFACSLCFLLFCLLFCFRFLLFHLLLLFRFCVRCFSVFLFLSF